MRVALLIALSLLWFPSETTAEIICGKAWVTLPGTVWSEHIHPADRRKQKVTVRKDDIDGMAIFFSGQGLDPTGFLSIKGQEGQYEVDAIDYFDVVECLD